MIGERFSGAWLGVLFALALLGGCATERAVFQYNAATPAEVRPLVWPPAESGDEARYKWVGQITGEDNFYKPHADAEATFSKIISFIIGLFGEEEPVILVRPQCGLTDESGRIYVADAGRNAVYVFDMVAGELRVWEKAEGMTDFGIPVGIAQGPGGDILVADAKLGIVARLDAQGNTRASLGKGLLKRPTGLAYDPVGKRIYVSDTVEHDIKVFDDGGRLVKTIGHRGEDAGEFNFPTHLAFARGELYVTDSMNSRIQVLSNEGETVRLVFGSRGTNVGDLVRPKGVAVDSEGNIYVIESLHDHLLVFNRNGELLLGLGGEGQAPGKFYLPAGVWIDAHDQVNVVDMFNGRVAVFQFLGGGEPGK